MPSPLHPALPLPGSNLAMASASASPQLPHPLPRHAPRELRIRAERRREAWRREPALAAKIQKHRGRRRMGCGRHGGG
nr:unnamed protein product [Digitaria exilis]